MANSKNTIQNIPLLGQLCLNTLKTDVTQFTDYNEKNSTVFGGELAPIWTKETELGNKDTTYTIFNSKGKAFTFNGLAFYKGVGDNTSERIMTTSSFPVNINLNEYIYEKYGVSDIKWASAVARYFDGPGTGFFILWINSDKLYWSYSGSSTYNSITIGTGFGENTVVLATKPEEITLASYNISNEVGDGNVLCVKMAYDSNNRISVETDGQKTFQVTGLTSKSFLSIGHKEGSSNFISLVKTTDRGTNFAVNYIKHSGVEWTEYSSNNVYCIMDGTRLSPTVNETTEPSGIRVWQGTISQFSGVFYSQPRYYPVAGTTVYNLDATNTAYTGTTGLGAPNYISNQKWYCNRPYQVYTTPDGNVMSLVAGGIPVAEPGSIINNTVSFVGGNAYATMYSYKKTDGNFWFSGLAYLNANRLKVEDYKNIIIDNRYVIGFYIGNLPNKIYDIETESFIKGSEYIGYIFSAFPTANVNPNTGIELQGTAIYGGGYNAGYEISGARFTGYLANPIVMTDFPAEYLGWSEPIPDVIQTYLSIGNTVQSAVYNGQESMYSGTVYPIDTNGNIILPYNLQAKVINGYTNNDMIISGNNTYPLIYYNNSQKIYSYHLLSAMENVENTFSLQGQRYAVNDTNIFSLNFENGIISNVVAVAYKKNMRYLGTLPTRAIFYSDFNKTFYQFTGDNILSKLFEASDIDKINFVGQNPSSLSLWIATDNGIYIMSDVDMFKLNYNAESIYFDELKVTIVSVGETNYIQDDIALWQINESMVEHPIKLQTKYYGLGSELKANYDCWYIRLHSKDHKAGKLKVKVNTITDVSFQTEEKVYNIEPGMYDSNDTIYIRYQPKYQTAVATQLELESDIAIYQISLGVNQTDTVAQQSKFNF